MKDWWLNLSLRDKQMVCVGSIVVILFLIYEIIWSPLVTANNNLRSRIQQGQDTLRSMKNADQLIEHLQKETEEKRTGVTESILGVMQTEINHSQFASHVTQLREADNDSVQFNLRKVDFDQLLVFLTSVWKKYGFIVSQITVMPTGTPGEVTVDVVMKKYAVF
jgi:type II secretory pathway component PulM